MATHLLRRAVLLLLCSNAAGYSSYSSPLQTAHPCLHHAFVQTVAPANPRQQSLLTRTQPTLIPACTKGVPRSLIGQNTRWRGAPQGLRSARAEEKQQIKTAFDSRCTVLVVGVNRGLGLEFAKQILKKGCNVIGTYRGEMSKELKALKSDRLYLTKCEVTEQQSVMAAASDIKHHLKHGLTHIIMAAGVNAINESEELNYDLVSPEEMMEVFKINTVGPLLIVQNFLPLCAEPVGTRVPIIAFLSSKVASIFDNQSGGLYAYRTSKAAMNQLAKNFYIDLKGLAAVLLLHPGYVRTRMTDFIGFIDPPESVAGMLEAIQATDANTPFRWVDYAGDPIDW